MNEYEAAQADHIHRQQQSEKDELTKLKEKIKWLEIENNNLKKAVRDYQGMIRDQHQEILKTKNWCVEYEYSINQLLEKINKLEPKNRVKERLDAYLKCKFKVSRFSQQENNK